jgi:hypothetical protein
LWLGRGCSTGRTSIESWFSLLDDVSDRRDHVLVTRNGTPAAALVPID